MLYTPPAHTPEEAYQTFAKALDRVGLKCGPKGMCRGLPEMEGTHIFGLDTNVLRGEEVIATLDSNPLVLPSL